MSGTGTAWIERLPRRWAFGGLVVGAAVTLFLTAIAEARPVELMWLTATLLYVVLPCAAVGCLWGWHERRAMRGALAEGPGEIDRRMRNEYSFVQAGKGAACGVLFGLLYVGTGVVGMRAMEHGPIAEFALTTTFIGIGAGVGMLVGFVAGGNLRRRLRPAPAADAAEPANNG
jgi:hypothetical protein